MSACCRMYALCLWKPMCDTVKPTSCSQPAHSTRCAASPSGRERGAQVERLRGRRHPLRVLAVDAIAFEEPLDGRDAAVALHAATEQVVEHAEPQRAADRIDALDAKLGQRGVHHREAAGEHRRARGLQPFHPRASKRGLRWSSGGAAGRAPPA